MAMVARLLGLTPILLLCLACPQESTQPLPPLWEGARWHDDWFAIDAIDERTLAISEPLYVQLNNNYLILGDERALIFDTGPGERDIRPVVEALTELPVTAVFSHAHYDHVGNHERFDSAALLDIPEIREQVVDGIYTPGLTQHMAPGRPSFPVTEWWKPGEEIDLGGRRLTVVHVPGHTQDSMALLDLESKLLFTGDYLYAGDLFAFGPGADLRDYVRSARLLVSMTRGDEVILGAHGPARVPYAHLLSLEKAMQTILGGEADYERAWFSVMPLRLYQVEGLAILTSLFPTLNGPVPEPEPER